MSIPHFRAISKKRQAYFVENPHEFSVQEKLDGSQFIIGNEGGRFYTGRHGDPNKYWTDSGLDDARWSTAIWTNKFRLAHDFISYSEVQATLRHELGENYVLNCEILSFLFPNALVYGTHQDFKFESMKIIGFGMDQETVHSLGHIDRFVAPIIDVVTPELTWVQPRIKAKFELSGLTNYFPAEWLLDGRTPDMDGDALNRLMIQRVSKLHGKYDTERIEGVVVKHSSGWSFKVVDSDWFLAQTATDYAFRKKLFKTPWKKSDSVGDTFYRNEQAGMPPLKNIKWAMAEATRLWQEYLASDISKLKWQTQTRNREAYWSFMEELKLKLEV